MTDSIAILDFGSQFAQLIARRVREAQVYCELFPWDAPAEQVMALDPKGFILSGGPSSAYEPGAPFVPDYVLASAKPVLGICYGMQALTVALGGRWTRPASANTATQRLSHSSLIPYLQPLNRLDVARRPHHAHAAGLCRNGEIGQQSLRGHGRFRAQILRRAVPPRSAPYPERHRTLRHFALRSAARNLTGRLPPL
jgi:anthranilate/para-aminobenzoate synthase component II